MAHGVEGGSRETIERRWSYYWYKKMHQEWEQRPPAQWFLAGFFQYKAPSKAPILQPVSNDDSDDPSKTKSVDPRTSSVFEWVQRSGGVYRG